MSARLTLLIGGLATCALATSTVDAANCALRNPDRQIYEIFPGATNYRTVVAQVGIQLKPAIENRLGKALAFGDLGKHTLCVVFRDGVPLGFIHARSEGGVRGSVELVWAMDLDMRIMDFRVQRSREKHTDVLRTDVFRSQLVGKNAGQLRSLISDSNETVSPATLQVSADGASIARLAVLSGAKTLIITDLAFRSSAIRTRLLGNIHRSFPQTHKVTKIKDPMNDQALAIIKQRTGASAHLIDRDTFTVLRSLDESGTTLGALAVSLPSIDSTAREQWWAVTADGRILKVWFVERTNDAIDVDLSQFAGRDLGGVVELADTTGEVTAKYAIEVLAALAAAGIGN